MSSLISILFLLTIAFKEAEAIEEPEEVRTDEPLWEWGILAGSIYTPDYPGSDQSRLRGIGFPSFNYRGKVFRSDEKEGTRARLISDPIYKVDVSFAGNFPVTSKNNNARIGMPNIDAVFELGPRLKISLLPENKYWTKLEFILPVRGVVTTNLKYWQDRGLTVSPGVQMGRKGLFAKDAKPFFRLSALFASERHNDLYYQVDPQYATAQRPHFDGKGGFNGINIFTGYALRTGKIRAFSGVYYSNFSGTTNHASALMRRNSNVLFILGFGWLFMESDERAYE